jgi:hypothetical protein
MVCALTNLDAGTDWNCGVRHTYSPAAQGNRHPQNHAHACRGRYRPLGWRVASYEYDRPSGAGLFLECLSEEWLNSLSPSPISCT